MQGQAIGFFVAGVCSQVAESVADAQRIRLFFKEDVKPIDGPDLTIYTRNDFKKVMLAVAKRAVEVLEGMK
jgi:hypothetical protein